ncbi:globin domain-containing protein [Rhodococcus sp. WMMA185]|uniref:globin domain-containing protein n=1 Tax=Rhodococcus sp. WMMA185 TaxID=679318 RepID=UPI0009FEEB86|nr:globin domain-containing protein [Rhodococcus sp. WMMA185]
MISRLRASFSSIVHTERGPTRLTALFFSSLFAEHPDFRALFPPALDNLGRRLFQALQFVIDNLDDEERVLGFLAQLGRDHRKFGVEQKHYLAAADALMGAVQGSFTQAIWTPSLTTAWTELIDLVLHTMSEAAAEDDLPATWGATVVDHERRLDDLAIVRLETDSPIPYAAGQYLSVQIPQRPRMWRYLSAAIPANPAGQLEFHVRRVSGGWVSPAIVNETRVGDRWLLGSPLGGLEVDRESGLDVLMIGSGTGIAPLRAQVMEMAMRSRNPRVHLFVGGKYPCDLYDIETLWHLSLSNPWLTVVPVSEEDENPWWHTAPTPEPPPGLHRRLLGQPGRVVAEFGSWADRQIQISGSPSMIKTTVYALQRAGTPAHLIKHDPLI